MMFTEASYFFIYIPLDSLLQRLGTVPPFKPVCGHTQAFLPCKQVGECPGNLFLIKGKM